MVCQKNYELDDGSGLIVMEDTQAIDTILDKHATMQSLGKDTGTKCRQMRYMISVDHIRMEVSRIPQSHL